LTEINFDSIPGQFISFDGWYSPTVATVGLNTQNGLGWQHVLDSFIAMHCRNEGWRHVLQN